MIRIAIIRVHFRPSKNPVWCKYSNDPYVIVINQYYG